MQNLQEMIILVLKKNFFVEQYNGLRKVHLLKRNQLL